MYIKTSTGVINLDHVIRIDPQSNGNAFFIYSVGESSDYAIVDFGSTLEDATTGVARLVHPIDPADLV